LIAIYAYYTELVCSDYAPTPASPAAAWAKARLPGS